MDCPMLRHCTRSVSLLALAVTGPFLASHTTAQARPHLANGVAQFAANQSDFTGSGRATHLGNYREIGNVVFTPAGHWHGFDNTSDEEVLLIWGWRGAGSLEAAGYELPGDE